MHDHIFNISGTTIRVSLASNKAMVHNDSCYFINSFGSLFKSVCKYSEFSRRMDTNENSTLDMELIGEEEKVRIPLVVQKWWKAQAKLGRSV